MCSSNEIYIQFNENIFHITLFCVLTFLYKLLYKLFFYILHSPFINPIESDFLFITLSYFLCIFVQGR